MRFTLLCSLCKKNFSGAAFFWMVVSLSVGTLLVQGCSLGQGRGFTIANLQGMVSWQADDRIGENDFFVTSKSYQVEFESFEIEVKALTLATSAAGQALVFDPANPPLGYSLCHNGHCHSESGELVDYDDIRVSLNGSATSKRISQIVDEIVTIDTSKAQHIQNLNLKYCTDRLGICEVGPDSLIEAAFVLGMAKIRLRAIGPNLPEEGRRVDVEFDVAHEVKAPIDISLSVDGPAALDLNLTMVLPPAIWDYVEFSELVGTSKENEIEVFRTALIQGLELVVE